MSGNTDDELISAVGRGNHSALGALFERYHQRVHSICYRMTGDASVADDLVQESFLRVLKYSRGFGGRAAFTTWLYRLVRNVCVDHLNAESRTQDRAAKLASETGNEAPGDHETDPRLDAIRDALHRLSPDKRDVLVLSRYEGLSYAEIAEICETTVGAIKARAHRAMRELRQQLAELEQAT